MFNSLKVRRKLSLSTRPEESTSLTAQPASDGLHFHYFMLKKEEPQTWPPSTAAQLEHNFVDVLPYLRHNTKSDSQVFLNDLEMSLVLFNSEEHAAAMGRFFTQGLLGVRTPLVSLKSAPLVGGSVSFRVIPDTDSIIPYTVVYGTADSLCNWLSMGSEVQSYAVTLFLGPEASGESEDLMQLCKEAMQCLG